MTRKSQPLVQQETQMETEVLDEVVLKDQDQDQELCVVGWKSRAWEGFGLTN